MEESPTNETTLYLQAWSEGDPQALEKLMPLVFSELRRIAGRYMARERPGHTLSPTALVNEAYLRLLDSPRTNWLDRAHFFAACALTMRHALVDWARSRQAQKRGGGVQLADQDAAFTISAEASAGSGVDIVALDHALRALAAVDERKSRVVELKFFGGLSAKETAQVLKVSPETVLRDWKLAKAWLRRELLKERTDGR